MYAAALIDTPTMRYFEDATGKAWQRIIREDAADRDAQNLLGRWWTEIDTDISRAQVREITKTAAKPIIDKYEWMGRMPAIVSHCFGIYFGEVLGGVVVYSPEYGENLGIWDKYGYTGKIILLSRGACVHWAHPHAASKLIRGSMKLLPRKYEVVTATVDELAGEYGTIYQACGFTYVGRMRQENPTIKTSSPSRVAAVINGHLYTGRALRHKFGTQKQDELLRRFPDAKFVKQMSKGRYFAFRASKKARLQHERAIAHLVQPYPKRDQGDSVRP